MHRKSFFKFFSKAIALKKILIKNFRIVKCTASQRCNGDFVSFSENNKVNYVCTYLHVTGRNHGLKAKEIARCNKIKYITLW